jgi:hypothetical protein
MGAELFETKESGSTVAEAYSAAVERALWDHGHAGYTGTIAEKDGYRVFTVPASFTAEDFAELIHRAEYDVASRDELVDLLGLAESDRVMNYHGDKWGPAVALKVANGEWLFCGWASC